MSPEVARRYWLLNTLVVFCLAVLALHGLFWPMFADDSSGLTGLIAGLMLVGLWEVWRGRWERVSDIADDLVFLGLIGTVIGFAVALSDITPARISAGQTTEMVGTFVQGARTALYTTIVGAFGNYWLRLNNLLLR